jgi:hypothetical protein
MARDDDESAESAAFHIYMYKYLSIYRYFYLRYSGTMLRAQRLRSSFTTSFTNSFTTNFTTSFTRV